jgi:hypothetical protein
MGVNTVIPFLANRESVGCHTLDEDITMSVVVLRGHCEGVIWC